jgi:Ca2+-transporting ATPase
LATLAASPLRPFSALNRACSRSNDVHCIRSDETSALRELFSNAWLWVSVVGVLAAQFAVLYVPTLQQAFGTVALDGADCLLCAAVASTVVYAREGLKATFRARDWRAAA